MSSEKNHLPCGLANLGNTCFLNSCVQLLNYTYELANIKIYPNQLKPDDQKPDDRNVFYDWLELRELMFDVRGRIPNPVITPGKFVKTIHDVAQIKGKDLFTGWAQNDLPEFLLLMIECIHNSLRREVNIDIRGTTESSVDDLALQCYTMLKTEYARGDYSELSNIFYGVYVSRLFNPEGNVLYSNKPELYSLLDLPIPATNTNVSLLDCFDAYVADETLTGWVNEKTEQTESVKKNIAFWSFPNVLIIILKRYSPDGRYKNVSLVNFPLDDLDLSKYVIGYKASSYKYKLFGVANHMGGISGGHYTAFVKPHDKWYCFNDSNVNEIPEQYCDNIIVSPSAYCLFYRNSGIPGIYD
jgi:ubiquitin C-terminal hydrolase